MNASGACSAPVVAVATGITPTAVGSACSQGGVPGTSPRAFHVASQLHGRLRLRAHVLPQLSLRLQ
jgi:hypothetical protein